jgi:hypothetical protein
MIQMSSEIIDHSLFFISRYFLEMMNELFWSVFREEISSFEEFRIIGDIGLMMTTVVNLHREGINMRLESIIRKRQRWERMVHKN